MYLKTLSIVLILFTSSHAYSLESDADAEIIIQSDRAEFDRKAGTAVYKGNVIFEQGTLLINAVQITLFSDAEQRLKKAIALGEPARFQQQLEGDKGLTQGQGQRITYLTQDKKVSFLKDAVLKQKGSSFSGNLIIYDIMNENIKMIIQPAKRSAETNNNEDT
jgi:lipopolysaccharide export system protein LptA